MTGPQVQRFCWMQIFTCNRQIRSSTTLQPHKSKNKNPITVVVVAVINSTSGVTANHKENMVTKLVTVDPGIKIMVGICVTMTVNGRGNRMIVATITSDSVMITTAHVTMFAIIVVKITTGPVSVINMQLKLIHKIWLILGMEKHW